jgi:hypothetical protein
MAAPPRSGSPRLAAGLADPVVEFHSQWEGRVLHFMSGRLGKDIGADDWAARRRADTLAFRRDVQRATARLEREAAPAVEQAIAGAYTRGRGQASPQAHGLAQRVLAALRTMWRRLTGQAERQWQQAITVGATAPPDRRRIAVQHLLDQLARGGFLAFRDARGRRISVHAFVDQTVRTAAGHAAMDGYLDLLQAAGLDLVQVRATPTSCPICIPWVGRVLSVTGDTRGYPTVKDARDAGLWHPNCGHPIDVWAPGRQAEPQVQRPGPYEQQQDQRAMERALRSWRRREAAALDDVTRKRAARKVAQWRAAIGRLVQRTPGLGRREGRERG